MLWIWALLFGAGCLLGPTGVWADSLWRGDRTASLFIDSRASRLGDLVTVLVDESSSTDRKAETNTKKESDNNLTLSNFFGNTHFLAGASGNKGRFAFEGDNEQKMSGNITRQDTVVAKIPARVVKVLENGLLVVEGRRAVVVNDETQTLAFSGVIRPEDIGAENTVRSTLVADAEISIVGKGILAEKQRPGILQRIFDIFRIF
jgi:flagellar L-ring protein precursor FlgH